ncbi:MAG: serine/threonine-protein kinase [Pseudomonadota bacterium]
MSEPVIIPGYRVIRPIGVGGMASVYLAMQESLDREVALKVMAPALAANQEFTDRFLKEGRITARLSHPNLVTVFDIGQYGAIYYLAAEFIPGGTLRDKLNQGLSVAEALDVVRDVAHGLHYAHECGFVHRDVKPGNVLFRLNGTAVLADFGIAKSIDGSTMATQVGSSIGTPHYMSPEQAKAEKVDGRSDLYSLGAMLFELLTGRPPYDAGDPFTIALMHVTHPTPQLPDDVKWLQPLVDRLMAKDAAGRYPTGEAFAAAVDQLVATAPEAKALSETPGRRRAAPRLSGTDQQRRVAANAAARPADASRPAGVLPAAGAVVVLAVAVAWISFGGRSAQPLSSTGTEPVAGPGPATVAAPAQAEPVPTPSEVPLTDLTDGEAGQQDVAALLATAQEYVRTGIVERGRRLAAPPGDNAIDLYLRVLQVEPGNAAAQAGLRQIADYYESKSKAAFDRNSYAGSMVLAEEGLRARPGDPRLMKLVEDSRRALEQ